MAPSTAINHGLDEREAHDDFAQLDGNTRALVIETVLAFGTEALLTGNGADQVGRIVAAITKCQRLGDAAVVAVQKWSRSIG